MSLLYIIEFLGDGFCDDQNNVSNCEYDHDDCCRLNDPYAHNYCEICLCKSNETNYPISFETKPTSLETTPSSLQDCLSHYLGDGLCDDQNNFSSCKYDNGDCCVKSGYENVWNDFCTECLCKSNETNYPSSLETHNASPFNLIE